MFGIPLWAWLLGGGVALYFALKRGGVGSTANDAEVAAFVNALNAQQKQPGLLLVIVATENVSDGRGRIWHIGVKDQPSTINKLWKQGGEWYLTGADAGGQITLAAPTLPELLKKLF